MSTRVGSRLFSFGQALFAVALFFVPQWALAASMSFSPPSGSFSSGQSFSINVVLNGDGAQGVNAADGKITFDATKLSVVSLSKDGSPLSLWPVEPKFSNTAGTIEFTGGALPPGFSGARNILKITFSGKAEGTAAVAFAAAKATAGAGQELPVTTAPASYTITAAAAPTPAPTPAPATTARPGGGRPPTPPEVKSPTHPEDDKWYATTTVRVTWDIPYGVTAVKTAFDDTPDTVPGELHEPPIGELTKTVEGDGIHYFHIISQNRGGWSEPSHRKFQIDTTPPNEFELTATGGDLSATLVFAAEDDHSGVAKYTVAVDKVNAAELSPADVEAGPFLLDKQTPGDHMITVTAIDAAGNKREVDARVTITGTLASDKELVEAPSQFGAVYWLSLIFVIIIGVLIAVIVYERKHHREEKEMIKREAVEVGDKLINIFEVLREEIEEKVLTLAHKPNITDSERTLLEGLKDAIDISEELLDKEIEDVRKLLK